MLLSAGMGRGRFAEYRGKLPGALLVRNGIKAGAWEGCQPLHWNAMFRPILVA